MSTHRLEPTVATTADVFSRAHAPVLTVEPGDTVTVASLDARGHLEPPTTPGEPRPLLHPARRGHCLTGPIAVRGAEPGQMLAVRVRSVTPGAWGWTTTGGMDTTVMRRLGLADGPTTHLLWGIDGSAGVAVSHDGFERRTAPFLGVMGVAPAEDGEHSTTPPRAGSGGNIDCRELVAGSTLYLPVAVDDALLYLGDGHAAQGDGEVCGTAIECPMTTEVVLDVVSDRPLETIHAETPAGRITFGFDADLNAATGDALAAMVRWMEQLFAVDTGTALALASTAVDLRITQIANQTWGVHAVLPYDAIQRA